MFAFLFSFLIFKNIVCLTQIQFNRVSTLLLNEWGTYQVFGSDWCVYAIDYGASQSIYKISKNNTSVQLFNQIINLTTTQIIIQQNNPIQNNYIYINSIIHSKFCLYKINDTSQPVYFQGSSSCQNIFTFSQTNSTLVYYVNCINGSFYQIDLTTSQQTSIILSISNYVMLNILEKLGYLIFNYYYVGDNSFIIFQIINSTSKVSIGKYGSSISSCQQCKTVNFDKENLFLIRVCQFVIQIWSVPSLIKINTKDIPSQLNNRLLNAIICNRTLIVLTNLQLIFYQTTNNWQQIGRRNISSLPNPPHEVRKQMKCLSNSNRQFFGFSGINSQNKKLFSYIQMTGVNTTIKQNNYTTFIETLIQNIFGYQKINKTTTIMANTASITLSFPLLKQFLKPFSYLIQELWYYGYHKVQYTEFVQTVTKKSDILNQLKIKPQFTQNLIPNISLLIEKNQFYLDRSFLPNRTSLQMYMLYSIQDIYTYNFAQGFLFVLLIYLLKKITKKLKNCGMWSYFLYKQFKRTSFLWGLLSVTIESNIGNVAYYGAVQFHVFFSGHIFDKFNLMFTLLIHFMTFFYCYTFYHLAYKYGKKKKSEQLLASGKYSYEGFQLQSIINCHRRFIIALTHGLFTNNHLLQMITLIFSGLANIIIVVRLRKYFSSRIGMFLTFSYILIFLIFDIGILVGTQFVFIQNLVQFRNNPIFNYYFVISILLLSFHITFQIILNILSSIYTKFNKIRKTNKIKDFKADEIIKVNIDKEKNKIIKKEKLTSIENNKNNNIVILINKQKQNNLQIKQAYRIQRYFKNNNHNNQRKLNIINNYSYEKYHDHNNTKQKKKQNVNQKIKNPLVDTNLDNKKIDAKIKIQRKVKKTKN